MARFSKEKWPADGPVRELLAYLDTLHRDAGQPSMSEMGRAISLAPSTVSAFFNGSRLIGRENLQSLTTHLLGDPVLAEGLRRSAATAWNEQRAGETPHTEPASGRGWTAVTDADGTTRLDVILFEAAANRLNRPELMVGRQDLVESIGEWLDAGRQVLLHGLGGSGKTALAATIADRRIDAGRGPYLWVRTGSADEDVILDALARCVAATRDERMVVPLTGDARALTIANAIAETGASLCVLDDVWHPSALHAVLRAMPPGLPILITSRLKLAVEHLVEVAGLDPVAATRLLAWHAQNDRYATHPDASAVCRDVGHHPYAIEIAGHHLRQYDMTPGELHRHIGATPHELRMPAAFAAAGRESVKRLLDRTVEALPGPDARSALAAFGGLFSGTVTPELLGCVLGIGLSRAQSALNALVDTSLAKRAPGARAYSVHDLTMSYARAMLGDLSDGKATTAAVRQFVVGNSNDHELLGYDLDNIVPAAELARTVAVDDFVAIVETLATGGYLDTHGHTLPLLRQLDAAIGVLRDSDETGRLHVLLSKRGNAHYDQGELPAAVGVYSDALALAPSPRRRIVLLSVIGKVLADDGQHDRSHDYFARAYALADEEADDLGKARILEQHSVAAFRQQDYARVRALTEQGVTLSRRLGDRTLEATFLNNLGTADFEMGVVAALRSHHEAHAIAVELGHEHIVAFTSRALGGDYHAQEKFEEAQSHFAEALRLYERLGQIQREATMRRFMRRFRYLDPADEVRPPSRPAVGP